MGKTIEFKRPDGKAVHGYLAEAEAPVGAVVVIQEWWGLNEQIRGVAERFANAGFTAMVPDLYRGKSTVEAEEAHHLMDGLNFGEAASQDVRSPCSPRRWCPRPMQAWSGTATRRSSTWMLRRSACR